MSHETDVQAQFSTRVPIYDRRSAWILDTEIIGAMVAAAAVRGDETLLDVCCGTGTIALACAVLLVRFATLWFAVGVGAIALAVFRRNYDRNVLGDGSAKPA